LTKIFIVAIDEVLLVYLIGVSHDKVHFVRDVLAQPIDSTLSNRSHQSNYFF